MPLHLHVPISPVSEREVAVLRVLGRLGATLGMTLQDLVCPDLHLATRARLLNRLVERKLVWQASIPNPNRDEAGRSRGRAPHVYGLTDDGKELLDQTGAEPHDGTYERLLARSKQAPSSPNLTSLFADTYLSDWCAALIDQVRRTPLLAGVQVQRRYAITDQAGALLQTIGAVLVFAFDPEARSFERRGWEVPWMSLGGMVPSWRVIRLAVEVDTGQAALRSIFDQAQRYAQLDQAKVYDGLFGGSLRPVLITPPGRRVRAVIEVWQGAWPGTPAVVSTFERTAHTEYGPLWGEYRVMGTNPPQPVQLLGKLLGTVDEWPSRIRQWSPALNPAPQRPMGAATPRTAAPRPAAPS